ncbi:hypothetical protein ACH5RR_024770 [Cinchona calisaya]|uniref:Late embryogenesis abundant protein LEA-2 subgroup domain-containing protein n=1 Tax=Cinchona calisaya TaxID=153742 RepID=A0ABD2YXQ9_9GENT
MSSFSIEDGYNYKKPPANNHRIYCPVVVTDDIPPAIGPIEEANGNNDRCNTLLKVVVLVLYISVCFWFVTDASYYSRLDPNFKIDSIFVSPLKISSNNYSDQIISTNWTIGISVENPTLHTPIIYDGFEVSLFYETDQNLCSTWIIPFNQEPKNTTTFIAESKTCSQGISHDLFARVNGSIDEDFHGISHFDLKLRVRYRRINPLWPAVMALKWRSQDDVFNGQQSSACREWEESGGG